MGLWCHMHLINQLSRDLGGGQWLSYDSEFREWAAAKGVRKWGDINMAIYGKCLSGRIALTAQSLHQAFRGAAKDPEQVNLQFVTSGTSQALVKEGKQTANSPTHAIIVIQPTTEEKMQGW